MNITTPRNLAQNANGVVNAELETSETAGRPTQKLSTRRSGLHFLMSLLSCAALGLTFTVAANAQDADKKMEDKKMEEKKAEPAAPAGPAPGTVSYSGLLDGSYQLNFQHQTPNATRAFDFHNNFALSLAEINITRTAGRGLPIGLTATLTLGDTPPVVQATEPGNRDGFKNIQQLYATYTPHVLGRDVAIDFGKFVTPFGVEVIESASNDNWSRGLNFVYAIPFYHVGFRVATPISKKINFTGGLVNGWNNARDDNNAKSFFISAL